MVQGLIYISILLLFTQGKYESQPTSGTINSIVEFRYEITSVNHESSSFKIKGYLINNSNDTINLLTYSCHGLRTNIVASDSIIDKYFWWHCNASVPETFQLLPNSTESIESDFKINEYDSEFNIGFKFNQLNLYYTREELMEISMFEDLILESKTIWGEPKTIKK